MMSKTDEILQLSRAEYFIAHSYEEVPDLEISCRLSQAASRLACAALELPCYGGTRKERRAKRDFIAALGCVLAMAAIAADRYYLDDVMISDSRKNAGLKWALEITPEWRCASDEQS